MGLSAARLHGAVSRALAVAVVAIEKNRPNVALADRDAYVVFVRRRTARLDAERPAQHRPRRRTRHDRGADAARPGTPPRRRAHSGRVVRGCAGIVATRRRRHPWAARSRAAAPCSAQAGAELGRGVAGARPGRGSLGATAIGCSRRGPGGAADARGPHRAGPTTRPRNSPPLADRTSGALPALHGALDSAAADLFAKHGPTGHPPRPWMFSHPPALADWTAQLGGQTRIEIGPDEALSIVREAWATSVLSGEERAR